MAVKSWEVGCSEDLLSRPRTEDACSSRAACPPRGKSPDRGQRVPRAAGARRAPQPTHAAETLSGRAGERGAGFRHGHRHAGSAKASPASRGRSTNRTGLTLRASLFGEPSLIRTDRSSAKSRQRLPSRAGLLPELRAARAPVAAVEPLAAWEQRLPPYCSKYSRRPALFSRSSPCDRVEKQI